LQANIWNQEHLKNKVSIEMKQNLEISLWIQAMGRLLIAMELRSASHYYHVRQNSHKHKDNTTKALTKVHLP